MLKYNGSKRHLDNLAKARKIASNNKIKCSFCVTLITKGNLKKHEDNCYLNPINKILCEVCDNPIKNFRTSKTCSYRCSNTKFRTGPNHGGWKEESYRTTCFHYHKKECVVCQEQNIVTVHHLDENNKNNKPENLIPLCPTHHQYWHSRYKHLIENKVNEYTKNWLCANRS
jgi:hypothetical protein